MNPLKINQGVLIQSLWPAPGEEGYAVRVFIKQPLLRLLLETYEGATETPIHIHTNSDRFLYLADGAMTLVTRKGCHSLIKGEAIIIRANEPHGFVVQEGGVRFSALSIGQGANTSSSALPESVRVLLRSARHDPGRVRSLSLGTMETDPYARMERQTLSWAKKLLIASIESGRPLPFSLDTPPKKGPTLQVWKCPYAFILKVRGYAIGFIHEEEPSESVRVHRVNAFRTGLTRSDQPVPVLKT